mmetsp:Transcript_59428/g.128516  ORF Transcript_59428/g.128516 Transcript_59428/m.128516 type:complete len:288 (-) Transcript_59428:59-922(-)|eukprot:CAMPEP_0170628128 /NCGR_PEP_ID=MMETSP0224-20130122/32464_1 /TAXON_ID=285029 /ORGANISM="Togula jolla, Strain CCCM 725" /LENGTH=287 /DNA_ID=CAMNT_0010955423 /DNA_START=32 /DNA_END=895 /DNA_ORIENTATION=+
MESWVSAIGTEEDLEEDLTECIAVWQERGPRRPGDEVPRALVSPSRSTVRETSFNQADSESGPVLAVNVGGQVFRATESTLRKAPFLDSLLRHYHGGELGATLDDEGRCFVDRPSRLFGYILDYLRSGYWVLCEHASDPDFVEALQEEACFYGLNASQSCLPATRMNEYVTAWQFRDGTELYVDCLETTIREDPDHQGLFRLCKYSGGLPLDQQTCTKRFKATTHSMQSVIAYFAMRGFCLRHVVGGTMITHTTSADGQSRTGLGVQYLLSRLTTFGLGWTLQAAQR